MTTLKISTGLYTIGNPRKKTKLKSKLSRALDKNKKNMPDQIGTLENSLGFTKNDPFSSLKAF
jgi:hypothetical protein